jgi:hypothetical protein
MVEGRARLILTLLLASLAIAALALRLVFLDTVPGVNGDEAWYGRWVLRCLHESVCPTHTPSGNLINPFYMALVAISQTMLGVPSVLALRLPAVVSGLAFIGAAYWLCRPVVGQHTAAIYALLAATLPADIAYSRFGWDTAQMGLAATLVLVAALRANWIACVVALAVCGLVHPTAVFLIPIVFMLGLCDIASSVPARTRVRLLLGAFLACAVLGMAVGVAWHRKLSLGLPNPGLSAEYGLAVAAGLVEFFSGVTTAAFLSGANPGWGISAVTGAVLVLSVLGLARREPDGRELATVLGVLLALLAFALAGGPFALSPGWERYALVLVAPMLLVVAMALHRLSAAHPWIGTATAALLGTLWLAVFAGSYLLVMLDSGGREADPATVGWSDPKLQAVRALADWSAGGSSLVAGEDWWITEPLAYFSYGNPTLTIVDAAAVEDWTRVTYAVTFPNGPLDRRLAETQTLALTISDRGGRPALHVWRLHQPTGS